MENLSPEDRARLLKDIQTYGGTIHAQQEHQWIRDAHHYTRKVALEGKSCSPEGRALFWIRLAGLLQDVREHLETQEKLWKTMMQGDSTTEARLRPTNYDPIKAVLDGIEAVMGSLSDVELLYLAYRRDVECHPWQDSYRLKLTKPGKLKEVRTVFRREWKIEEAEAAIANLLRSYQIDEAQIAADFASRVSAHVERVAAAAQRWFTAT
jgi:hypothetical protein